MARSLMCSGVDAAGWDAENKLIFESCNEGVISVIHQIAADHYQLMGTVKTQLWARTMAFDAKTKKIFLLSAEFENAASGNTEPYMLQMKPGSFAVLVVAKVAKIVAT